MWRTIGDQNKTKGGSERVKRPKTKTFNKSSFFPKLRIKFYLLISCDFFPEVYRSLYFKWLLLLSSVPVVVLVGNDTRSVPRLRNPRTRVAPALSPRISTRRKRTFTVVVKRKHGSGRTESCLWGVSPKDGGDVVHRTEKYPRVLSKRLKQLNE